MAYYEHVHTLESPSRFPMEVVSGYNTMHGFQNSGKTLQTYQNAWPGFVEQIKEGLGQPMKELQDEVAKLQGNYQELKKLLTSGEPMMMERQKERKLSFRKSYK